MQIIFMVLFILIGFSAPILLTALLVYLLFWLMETAHTVLLGCWTEHLRSYAAGKRSGS